MPQNLLAIHGVSGFVCAVGESGRILMFTGDNYAPREAQSPTAATLRAVYVASPAEAWAVGDDGTVLWWNGDRWYHQAVAGPDDKLLAVAGGDGGLWIGGDGRLILHKPESADGMHITCMRVVRSIACSGTDAWFLMDDATVMHADDAGCRVVSMEGGLALEHFKALAIGGPDEDLFVVGQAGAIVRQNGEQWDDIDSGTFDDLLCIAADGPDLWVGTHRGELRHSWDRGATWETAARNVFGAIYSVAVVDGAVWAIGEGGVVIQHRPASGEGE